MRIQGLRQANDKGASAVEYTVIIALVAIALILVLIFLGQSIARAFMGAGEAVPSAPYQGNGACSAQWFQDPAPACDEEGDGTVDANSCADGRVLVGDGSQANPYTCRDTVEAAAAAGPGSESQTPVCDAFDLNSPANGVCADEVITCDTDYTLTDGLCVADATPAPSATPTPTETATPTPAPSIACSGSVSTKATQGSNTAPSCDTTTGTWQCATGELTDNGSSHWYCKITATSTPTPTALSCPGTTYDPSGSDKYAATCNTTTGQWTCNRGDELKSNEGDNGSTRYYCKV